MEDLARIRERLDLDSKPRFIERIEQVVKTLYQSSMLKFQRPKG
jgi:hypothetical protein